MHLKKNENLILINSQNFRNKQPKSWLQRQALLHPNHLAFTSNNCQFTFSELNHYIQKYVSFFQEEMKNQNKEYKRVAILSNNHPKMYFTILALWELGIEVQLLNTRLTKEELMYQLKDANTHLLITELYEKTEIRTTLLSFPKSEELKNIMEGHFIDLGYQDEHIASIMYTSGTTGKPKGVPQTFGNHKASSLATQKSMNINSGESWLCCVPLYHISGLSILLRSLVLGIGVHLCENFDPKKVNQFILKSKVNYLSLVTKMLRELIAYVSINGYPEHFKQILLGGGPVELSLLETCKKNNLSVMFSYGMTETCAQVVAGQNKLSTEKKGTVGKPLFHVQLKIKEASQPYEAGEILLKGPSIVTRYLNDREKACWNDDGWFSTGDWGYLDRDGDLFILSRMSERIISGGENIYPSEIETAFLKSKKVAEAIVVGKKDAIWGQRPVAYIKLQKMSTLTHMEIQELLQFLAPYKHPDEIFIVHEIPKTASGKTLKRLFLTEERVNYIDYQLR